jgi:hypothetical protein
MPPSARPLHGLCACLLLSCLSAVAQAQPEPPKPAADPALDYLINTASVATWNVYGDKQTSEKIPCNATGKLCLKVAVQERHANAWDVGAIAPIHAAIRKGDRLQVLLWGRLDSPDPKASAVVTMAIQLATPPYTPVVTTPVTLTPLMSPLLMQGVAAENQAEGAVMLSVQLGHTTLPVELSAPYVLRNYKPAK